MDYANKCARIQVNVGSLLDLSLSLTFFAKEEDDQNPAQQSQLIRPSIFKQLLQSVVENTYSASIMKNLGFLLASKFLN